MECWRRHDLWKRTTTSWKKFGNSLREYEVNVGAREIDLLHAMQVKSEEIKNIVRISVQQSPQKI